MKLLIGTFIVACAFCHVSAFLTEDIESVMVRRLSTHYDRHRRSADSECFFPPLMRFEFDVNDIHIVLNLEKNTLIPHNIPIYITGDGGRIVRDTEIDDDQKYALYQDKNQGGAILVSCEGEESYSLHGTFRYNGVMYHMNPDNTAEVWDKHIIRKENKDRINFGDDGVLVGNSNPVRSTNSSSRQKRAIPSGNIVEMVFAIDYYTYDYYGRDVAAEAAIRRHIAMLANEVDIYYANIPSVDPSLNLRIYVSSIYINTDAGTSDWSTNAQTTINGVVYLPYDNLVGTIQPWLSSVHSDLEPYDHVMTMSLIEFAGVTNGVVTSTGYTGVAYVGTVCDTVTISFTQLEFFGRTAQTMAHELGHALSAKHDGDGNICAAEDHNVMTPSFYVKPDSSLAEAQWTFSQCSIDYFKAYISGLGSSNCLQSHTFTESEYNDHKKLGLPGDYYSLTDQCVQYVDASSVPCSVTDDTVTANDCYDGFRCSVGGNTCSSYTNLYPLAGTKCGDSSKDYICFRGLCQDRSVVISTTTSTTSTTTAPSTTSTTEQTTSTTTAPSTTSTTEQTTSTTTAPSSTSTTERTTSTTTAPSSTSTTERTTSTTTAPSSTSTTERTTSTTPSTTTASQCDSTERCCQRVKVGKRLKTKCCNGLECCEKPDWFSPTQCYDNCCVNGNGGSGNSNEPSTTTPSTLSTTTSSCNHQKKCCENVQLGKKLKNKCCSGQSCCARPDWFRTSECFNECCDVTTTTTTTSSTLSTDAISTTTTQEPCDTKQNCCVRVKIGRKTKKKCCKGPSCCSKPAWYSSTDCYQTCCGVSVQ